MKQSYENRRGIGGVIAFVLSAAACSQVLGIDDARVDPNLTPGATTGGTGLDASSGGSGGAMEAGLGGETGGSAGSGGTGGASGASMIDSGVGQPESGSDSGASPTCDQYCSDIMGYCKDTLAQYVDTAQCLKVCAIYPEGKVTDPDGNTSSCRLRYASKARYALGIEREAYCRKAGPGSDGTCGTICEGFCTLMMPTCTTKQAPYFFSSLNDCMMTCGMLKDAPPYTVSDGQLPDRNDAQCRLFHVCSAVMDPDEHCEHAMGVTMCDPKFEAGHD